MENRNSDNSLSLHDTREKTWQDTINLLKVMQSDFHGTRVQLEVVSTDLAKREAIIDKQIQYASLEFGGYRPLRLIPYAPGTSVCQMGKSLLGELQIPEIPRNSVRFEVFYLGRFEVRFAQKRIEHWQSFKSKSVFQYLVSRCKEPVVKDVLIETLWPNCTPRAANSNLKVAIHGVRQTLNSLCERKEKIPYILFSEGSYRTDPETELWLDVEEFEYHWHAGRRFEKLGKHTQAICEFEAAEALYRGDYLEDEPYQEWTQLRREELKDIYLSILTKLADYSLDSGDYENCIARCQKVLKKDASCEDIYRRLIRCYSRAGQRNRALRWYEICCEELKKELDAEPENETSVLYEKILRGERI